MQTHIIEQTKTPTYKHIIVGAANQRASFYVHDNGIQVVNMNASHKAWGGMGRHFDTWEDVRAGYKSSVMQSMIHVAYTASL